MNKINFEVGEIITPAKVNEDGTITSAVWKGTTPLSPFLLNQIQENIEKDQTRQDNEMTNTQNKIIKVLQEVETPTPVSGENIDINDSAEAKITELNIRGNSKQETRSGYNLVNFGSDTNTSSTFVNNTLTVTGNTTYCSASFDILDVIKNNVGKTLYFSCKSFDNSNSIDGCVQINYNLDGTFYYHQILNKEGNFIPFLITEGIANSTEATLHVYCNNSSYTEKEYTTVITEPMLAFSEGLEYEQYGASPSPDYPSEVESCGDNVNLFDKDNVNILNNMFLNTTNKNIVTYSKRKCFYLQIKPNTTYTISGNYYSYGTTEEIPDSNSNLINVGWTTPATFISSSNVKYLVVYYLNENDILTEQEILDSIKIEKGPTSTPYSPYGQGCINEVICNKNLFDKNNIVSGARLGSDGTNYTTGASDYFISEYIKIEKDTTYSVNFTLNSMQRVCYYDKDLNFIETNQSLSTFTTPSNAKYLRFSNLIANIETIQLEEGSTATDYVKHKSQTYTIPTQQPFRAIENIRDTFIKKNNKWYERHEIGEVVFDGSENWKSSSLYLNCFYANVPNSLYIDSTEIVNDKNIYVISDRLKNVYRNNLSSNDNAIALSNGNNIMLRITGITTVDELKVWLASNNVKVYYILATPLDIECTEEQSTILWDIEQNAKTYKNITHIFSTDNVSPNIELTYKKDIETLFANTLVESGV